MGAEGLQEGWRADLRKNFGTLDSEEQRYADKQELSDISPFILKEIANFFSNYKVLQNIKVEVGDYYDKEDAIKIIAQCRQAFLDAHKE